MNYNNVSLLLNNGLLLLIFLAPTIEDLLVIYCYKNTYKDSPILYSYKFEKKITTLEG